MNKTISMVIVLLCLMVQGAWAEDVNYIYYTVNPDGKTITQHIDGLASNPTAITSNTRKLDATGTELWYVVSSNVTINTKERLDCYGTVNIILKDKCTLTVPKGIRVSTSCTLNIYAQSEDEGTMGGIHAEGGGEDWAAIGGHKNYRGGTLNIHGGIIYAEAKHNNAAGIGGGNGDGSGMVAINIFGGKVEAHGKSSGAGIGGGQHNNNPGIINIYGGDIKAYGGPYGAGIGGGEDRGGWDTNIYGGTVYAKGGESGAGIGGGDEGDGGNINIYGGNTTALGGEYGAGIGGGLKRTGGNITITGGIILASSMYKAAGIGGGASGHGGTIKISGTADVTARGGIYGGAGIGGGINGEGHSITISGGLTKASGYGGGAGIGGGLDSNGGTITINGGEVKAEVYPGDRCIGAGIGSGHDARDYNITISGGKVTALGDSKYDTTDGMLASASIGSGSSSSLSATNYGTVKIQGGEVYCRRPYVSAGIGGGNSVAGGTIIISGGRVEFTSTDKSTSSDLGRYIGGGEGKSVGDFTLDDFMHVSHNGSELPVDQRASKCNSNGGNVTDILVLFDTSEDNTAHNLNYSFASNTQHNAWCSNCKYAKLEDHEIISPSEKCSKCGYGNSSEIITIAFPQVRNSNGGYEASDYNVLKGTSLTLPQCTYTPDGYEFAGWLESSNTPEGFEHKDGENLLPSSSTYPKIEESKTFYARYDFTYNYSESWIWTDNNTASVRIQCGNIDETLQATITTNEVQATSSEPGYIEYVATATYLRPGDSNDKTSTFTMTRTQQLFYSLELGEDDNTLAINECKDNTVNASLTGRTLYKDGYWNTLCLPFDVMIEDSPLAGATLKEFVSANFDNGTLTLDFDDATSIKAGRPYLIKWDEDQTSQLTPSDLVFPKVSIRNEVNDETCDINDDMSITFCGTYKPVSFGEGGDNTVLYLGADNTLYYPSAAMSIGAQRAYFQLNGLTAGEPTSTSTGIKAFNLNFGDEETGIREITTPSNHSNSYYTLDGRRIGEKPTIKGLYIHNGQKMLIK